MPSTNSTTLFLKGLKPGGTPPLARTDFRWPLPTQDESGVWTPGEWAPKIKGRAIACQRGYHLIRATDISFWVREFWELEVYVAEVRGTQVTHGLDSSDPKVAVLEARLLRRVETWNPATLRLWLCDVAEHVLPLYEDKNPGDARVRECIEATRQYLRGEITQDQLAKAEHAASAAASAASAAASAYASAYASAAASAATSAYAYAAAAASAAASAATSAAYAARRKAEQSERSWQSARLLELLGINEAQP